MNEEDVLSGYLEMWKKTIEVQQHFNDIEMRIRGLALTVLTLVLGGATFAGKSDVRFRLLGVSWRVGAVVLIAGAIVWLVFYFMDQIWYHRLLVGAVRHGEQLELKLRNYLPEAGLTHSITESSKYRLIFLGRSKELHSVQKLRVFYWVVAALLIALAVIVQLGS